MKIFKEFPYSKQLSENNYLYYVELSKNIKFSHDGSVGHIQYIRKKYALTMIFDNVAADSKKLFGIFFRKHSYTFQ